jgi:hypothetical protein
MKNWKLISGILSIVFAGFVFFQSFAAGLADALGGTDTGAMTAGIVVAIMMIAAGIVSIVTRKAEKNGGNIAQIVMFAIAAVVGFAMHAGYSDLVIWATWCCVCAIIAGISAKKNR